MKHIKLLLSVSFLILSLRSQCQIFKNKSVFIISGIEFESTFLVKDSISVDSVNSDTIFYTLQRETIKGDLRGNYSICKLIEVQNRLFASLITMDGDTIPQTLIYDFNLGIGDTFSVSIPKYGVSESKPIYDISKFALLTGDSVSTQIFDNLWEYYPLDMHLPAIGSNVGPLGLFQYILHDAIDQNSGIQMTLVSCCADDTLLFINSEYLSDTTSLNWCNSAAVVARALLSDRELEVLALEIYPNPVNGLLSIVGLVGDSEYRVYDSKGNLLLTGLAAKQIEVSRLHSGLYFIEIRAEDALFRSKFIKE